MKPWSPPRQQGISMTIHSFRILSLPVLAVLATSGCSGSKAGDSEATDDTATNDTTTTSSDQIPPMGEANIKAWLATGVYNDWHCESAEHDARSPSPHGVNRICSNDVLSAGSVPFAKDSAGVKELWDKAGGQVMGYAVYLKTDADSANGANWYWYEDNPAINPVGGVVADGMGTSGNPKDVCVSCHVAAASDDQHPGAGDFVYT